MLYTPFQNHILLFQQFKYEHKYSISKVLRGLKKWICGAQAQSNKSLLFFLSFKSVSARIDIDKFLLLFVENSKDLLFIPLEKL